MHHRRFDFMELSSVEKKPACRFRIEIIKKQSSGLFLSFHPAAFNTIGRFRKIESHRVIFSAVNLYKLPRNTDTTPPVALKTSEFRNFPEKPWAVPQIAVFLKNYPHRRKKATEFQLKTEPAVFCSANFKPQIIIFSETFPRHSV